MVIYEGEIMVRTMSKAGWGVVAVMSLVALAGCHDASKSKPFTTKVVLWNGQDFTGWTRVLQDPHVDVDEVWRVRDGVLFCSGKPYGYMRTQQPYTEYHLHVEWRWPETPANSGVFVHAGGPDHVWPVCIECQLKAGSAGDFVLMNGADLTVAGKARRDPTQQFVSIRKKNPSTEKPAGQWNTYDIECRGGAVRCLVNGTLQNEGTKAAPSSGWICLQSEGGPIEFRNIYLLTK
jgi:hypothetical protein